MYSESCSFADAAVTVDNLSGVNSVAETLQDRAIKTPNFTSYTFIAANNPIPTCLTNAELDQKARTIAACLQEKKTEGERAILIFEPGLDYIASIYGCLYAKVLAVPVYPPLNKEMADHLIHIIENSQAKFILTTSTILARLNTLNLLAPIAKVISKFMPEKLSAKTSMLAAIASIKKLQIICIDKLSAKLACKYEPQTYDLEQVAYLQYTSGSTSAPKGVMVTNKNLLTNLAQVTEQYSLTEKDIFVSWLPPYHDMGLVSAIFTPIYVGLKVVHMSPFDFIKDPYFWLAKMSEYQATIGCSPDFGYRLCIKKIKERARHSLDLHAWRVALSGSEVIHADTLINFYHAFKSCGVNDSLFFPSYGLAEATVFVSGERTKLADTYQTFNRNSLQKGKAIPVPAEHSTAKKIVSHGKPPSNILLQIVNPEQETIVPDTEVGEIWVSGENVVPGYWGKPTESTQLMHAKLEQFPNRSFLRTGDLGFISDGKLYIVGRCKDLIIISGKNHYPQDIECDIEAHIDSIRPGCIAAFSIERHHQEHVIIVAEYKLDSKDATIETYQTLVKEIKYLVTKQHQVHVEEVALISPQTIPKTTSGKIQRSRCKDLYIHHKLKIIFKG